MANIKSAKKRILVNRTKAERNKSIRSAVKTAIKKVEVAVVNKDKETAVPVRGKDTTFIYIVQYRPWIIDHLIPEQVTVIPVLDL